MASSQVFLVLDFVGGGDLFHHLRMHKKFDEGVVRCLLRRPMLRQRLSVCLSVYLSLSCPLSPCFVVHQV